MADWLALSWKVLVVRGVLGIVFGILAMTWPGITVLALVVLWGLWALTEAVAQASAAVASGVDTTLRVLYGLSALVSLFVGLFAIVRPGVAAVTLTWVLGIWLLVRAVLGVAELFSRNRSGSTALLLLGAALDLLLGILLVANPGRAALDIAWVLGLVAVVWGVVFVVTGLMTRRLAGQLESDARPSASTATSG